MDSSQELQKVVAATTPGRAVPLKVWRDKSEKTLEIKIGETVKRVAPCPASRRPTTSSSGS